MRRLITENDVHVKFEINCGNVICSCYAFIYRGKECVGAGVAFYIYDKNPELSLDALQKTFEKSIDMKIIDGPMTNYYNEPALGKFLDIYTDEVSASKERVPFLPTNSFHRIMKYSIDENGELVSESFNPSIE